MDELDSKLVAIVRDVSSSNLSNEEIVSSMHLMNDLALDSVKAIRLVIACEDAFGIQFEDERLLDVFGSYGKLKQVIVERLE